MVKGMALLALMRRFKGCYFMTLKAKILVRCVLEKLSLLFLVLLIAASSQHHVLLVLISEWLRLNSHCEIKIGYTLRGSLRR